ncbi:SPOR domain-containing protein [Ramlibacter sp. Leaf400]|uniref:SPOR domain-containing protein n=1 Tax=Ramlibacter sp. Leaf400 TaxID=1736365 RepID=UPI0006F7FCB6|nr:SPOR domain-containing protein [Ramlibacter sp. Leaf400]KQT13566.1 hypothetical protein ASG30_19300 [Ramlibacter sp. Leaf400]
MAFFKFRKGGDETQAAPPQAESVEVLRRRARHRLIGAAVLVLLGVVGFPLLFDTQPRPIAVDIPIEIPDRNKAKPLPVPVASPKAAQASEPAAPVVAGKPAPAPVAAGVVSSGAVTPATPVAPAVAEARPEPKPETRAEAKPKAEAKAPAPAPEARPVQAAAAEKAADGRYVVQVGAFSDVGKAREARQKVEKAGLKTYTHVAETKDGRRIRVRVGPFATRAEADKAAGRLKDLDLPAAILTL